MNRIFIIVLLAVSSFEAVAQERGLPALIQLIPPGPPYDPAKHVNPVITYVQSKDFKTSTYKEAQQAADIQLLGLSKEVGSVQSIEVAPAGVDTAKVLKLDIKATFYPVVRQTFKIAAGGEVVLHSFKTPRVQGNPMQEGGPRLGLPFPIRGRGDPKNKRFGAEPLPEELEVRDHLGLIFEKENSTTVVWQEDGVTHTATSSLPRRTFFEVLDDLL